MLDYKLLKNHAGIYLTGNYDDMVALRDAVHSINELSPIVHDKEGLMLGLAYDARKAHDGHRVVYPAPSTIPEKGILVGVEILWPVFLLQVRIMRVSLGFMPHDERMQSIVYALESVAKNALQDDFKKSYTDCLDSWLQIDPAHPYAEETYDNRCAMFTQWSKKERATYMPSLLRSMDLMFQHHYRMFADSNPEMYPAILEPIVNGLEIEWADPQWD